MAERVVKDCWNKRIHQAVEAETTAHLWRYIQRHSRIATPAALFLNVSGLSAAELRQLATVHLLMSDRLLTFLERTAPELLRRLSRTVLNTRETSRAGIRGRINWQETYTRRLAEGSDPSVFVTTDRSSFFDLPENRIFRFLLQRLQQLAQSFLASGSKPPGILDERLLSSPNWKVRLEQVTLLCGKMLRNVQLQNCTVISAIGAAEVSRMSSSRNVYYRELAEMAAEFRLCFASPETWLAACIGQHVLMPLERNTLYELAVLFRIMERCPENGWEEHAVSLIGGGSRRVSTFKRGETLLHIYYQGLPATFEGNSAYGVLMARYGLSDRLRRPDIILEVIQPDGERRYFITEVKRSEERKYIVDGVYKLLGYLRDYADVEQVLQHRMTGVLVSWAGIGQVPPGDGEPIYITQWTALDELFRMILP